jgi:acetyl esterase/lipase
MPASKPTAKITYGPDPLQYAELRVPESKGPHPVAILIHGGCWLASVADLTYFRPMADALTKKGLATYTIEYRRVGDRGGGWPGTFLDVGHATDHLRTIAKEHNLDLSRVIVVGHSAGGHLALWTAARHKLPRESELFTPDPLKILAAVNLAGPGDLTEFTAGKEHACGDAVDRLIGGKPADLPKRYRDASPITMLPLGVRQVCISGADDKLVPTQHVSSYAQAAKKAGDETSYLEIAGADHFAVVAPGTKAWSEVQSVVVSLFSSDAQRP